MRVQKRFIVGLLGIVLLTVSARAAKPSVDDDWGSPGLSPAEWAAKRQAQAEQQKRETNGSGRFVNLRETVVKQDAAVYQENGPVNFYTGKPYDEDLGSYIFKYRNYSPSQMRWSAQDPSGFPDGANNYCYVANPSLELDMFGLKTAYLIYVYSSKSNNNGNCFVDVSFIHSDVKQIMESADNISYIDDNNPGTLYLKGSGNIAEDLFEMKGVKSLTQLQALAGGDCKIYIAAHGFMDWLFDENGIATEKVQFWNIGTDSLTTVALQQLLGDSFGYVYGCGEAGTIYKPQLQSVLGPKIMDYLYE